MGWMSGARALTETLVAEGVELIFGNPGTTELALLRAVREEPRLRYVLVLQEAVALGMADGYGRASGKVPFVNLHTVPGLANGLSVLYNLRYGGSPLVLTAGSQDSRIALREPWLSGDLVGLARPLTKWAAEVHHAADLPRALHRAFKVAAQPPQGPVFLSLPQDVLLAEAEIPPLAPTPVYDRLRPDPRALEAAAATLAAARAPLVLVGDGVDRSGAQADAVAAAELLGAPVYSTWLAGLQFPTTHPLWGGLLDLWGTFGRQTLRQADVVLALGTDVFQSLAYHEQPLLDEGARVVHLHPDPWELGKNEPSVAVQGDVREALAELLPLLEARLAPAARQAAERRLAVERRLAEARAARRARWHAGWEQRPIRPGRLMAELVQALPGEAAVVDDAISSGPPLRDLLPITRPGVYYNTRGGGALGWGIGAALGIALAQPGREVVAVVGDGTALMAIHGLWTAAEQRLPVKLVVCDNASYRVLRVNANRLFGDETGGLPLPGLDFDRPRLDFVQLAEGFGVPASRVEDPAALGSALRELFSLPGPALLDVVVDPRV